MPIITCADGCATHSLITSLFIEDGKEHVSVPEFRDTVAQLWNVVMNAIHADLLRATPTRAWGRNVLSVIVFPSGAPLIEGCRRQFPEIQFMFIVKERLIPDHETPPQIFDLGHAASGIQLAVVCDPVIATGKTMCETIDVLEKDHGIPSENIAIATLFCAKEAARRFCEKHRLYLVTSDGHVERNMLVPGPGHFSKRWCGML